MRSRDGALRLAVAAVVGLVAACSSDGGRPPTEPVRPFTAVEQQVASAATDFGLALLREVNADEAAKPNVLVSPLSASVALGMTLNGADGDTYDAMRRTLGFRDLAQAEVNAAYRGLIAQLHARDQRVEIALANSVWYRRGFPVFPSFIDTVRTAFGAEIRDLDFSDPASPGIISAWAEQQTNGRIKDLVKAIDSEEVMFLVNAVYFKAPWSTTFDKSDTRPASFTRLDGSTVTVPTMSREGSFRMLLTPELRAVELPYGDSAFSMVLVAPAAGHLLDPVVGRLEPQRWEALLDSMRVGHGELTLPKFTFSYGKRLNDPLTRMGMGVAFDRTLANFGRIADLSTLGGNLYISRVDQKAFINVDESGTEAAAATNVGVGLTSLPPQLRFDRPFIFVIRERTSGTILFAGRLADPSASPT